jgi:hypothetical protein
MASFKAQSEFLGRPVEGDSDDDDADAESSDYEDAEDEEVDGDEGADEVDTEGEEEGAGTKEAGDKGADIKTKRREQSWLQSNFIKATKTQDGTVYKSELLPDKVFFAKETLREFVEGKRYKRLLHEMRKGMRTHQDTEKLKAKADARRERQQVQRQEKRQEKRRKRRASSADEDEISRRQAAFAAKKARRLERKAAAVNG